MSRTTRLTPYPPDGRQTGLVGSVARRADDGTVTHVNVWETPTAVADFYLERVEPLIATDGPPPAKPVRHGEPVTVYLRGSATAAANRA